MEDNIMIENEIEQNNEGVEVDALEPSDGVGNPDAIVEGADSVRAPDEEGETFDRKYVEKLRKENAKYRERAGKTDELAQRLHAALVAADGRLADSSDLEFNETHLEDPEALAAAVADLIDRKPGLRAQQLGGDVGAGKRGSDPKLSTDLLSIIRGM